MDKQPALISHFFVKLEDEKANEPFMDDLAEVIVENSLHLPDVATFILHDPKLRWVDDKVLEPGKTVKVSAKAESAEKPLFDGELVEIEPDYDEATQKLTVRAYDRLHRLSRGRHIRSFQNVTDGDVVETIARELGFKTQIGKTPQVHPFVLQSNQTNLEFLQSRASALGYLLFVDGKTLHFEPPTLIKDIVEVKWAQGLNEFHPRLSTIDQVSETIVRGWDAGAKRPIEGKVGNGETPNHLEVDRLGGDVAKKAFGNAQHLVTDHAIHTQASADELARAVANDRASTFIEADGRCSGEPRIVAGGKLKISCVGDRFKGEYFITSAVHRYKPGQGYSTEFSVSGYHPSTLLTLLQPRHARQAPAAQSGVVVGIVTDLQDPEGQGRVKVKYPWFSEDHASFWARVAIVGGGSGRGVQFLPEVNDEVLIGFEMGDMHHPFILGGLWNGKDAPPKKTTEVVNGGKVQERLIKSRTGHLIILDDKDGAGGITVKDRKGNRIEIHSDNDSLLVEMKGDIKVKSQGKIEIQAQQDISLNATGKMELKAGAGIEINGGPKVDVKGGMINLN